MAAPVLFFLFLLTMPLAEAQTNSADLSTPATNAPADLVPALPPVPAAPTANLSGIPGQPAVSDEDGLADVRPPFFHSDLWKWILAGVLGAIAVAILLWFLLRPRRPLSARSAYELTLEKLEKARALLQENDPMPYAVFVSETIRSYLGLRFQAPSTRRTTEEFLRQMEDDRTTPLAEHRDLLRDFLQSCDLVKFARYRPTVTELEHVQESAYSFVTATKPEPTPAHANGRHA